MAYAIQVYGSGIEQEEPIVEWFEGEYERRINEGSFLSFTVKYDNASTAYLDRPQTVWLRNKWLYVEGKFRIRNVVPYVDEGGRWLRIECIDQLAQLGEEPLLGYDVTPDDAWTVEQIVADLLNNYQNQDPPVTIGLIHPTIAMAVRSLSIPDGSILEALRMLHSTLPLEHSGYFYTTPSGALNWDLSVGYRSWPVISAERNARMIQREKVWSEACTKVFYYGEGLDPRTWLKLTDAGHPTDYYEETPLTHTDTIVKRKQDRRIKHAESLLQIAERYVAEHKDPLFKWTVDMVNMSEADDPAWAGTPDVYPGQVWRVYDADLGFDSEVYVRGVTVNLDEPLNISVDLGNHVVGVEAGRRDSLDDIVGDIYKKLNSITMDVADGIGGVYKYPHVARQFANILLAGTGTYESLAYRHGDWVPESTAVSGVAGGLMKFVGDDAAAHRVAVVGSAVAQDVAAAGAAGTAVTASPIDHVHKSVWIEYTGP